jgi:hypothetical protein
LKFYQFTSKFRLGWYFGSIKNNKINVNKCSLKSNKKKEEFRSLSSKFHLETARTVPKKNLKKNKKKLIEMLKNISIKIKSKLEC